MGYFVETKDINVRIAVDKADAALAEMKRINGPEFDHLKRGGSWGPEGKSAVWYSWMPESFDEFETLEDFLCRVGFYDTKALGGYIQLGHYDNKTGSEEVFLKYLAPFIEAGSYIVWEGEDGALWRDTFDGETMNEQHGVTEIHWV